MVPSFSFFPPLNLLPIDVYRQAFKFEVFAEKRSASVVVVK